jgi:hypothetical protein
MRLDRNCVYRSAEGLTEAFVTISRGTVARDGAGAPPHHQGWRPSRLTMPQAAIAAIASEISTL